MRALLLAALGGLMILSLAGCSGSVAIRTPDPEPTPIRVPTWPTVPQIKGDFPVGQWLCLPDVDYSSMRTSNNSTFPNPCNVLRFGNSPAAELRADGTGRSLNVHRRPS